MKVQIYGDSIMKAVTVDENFKYRPLAKSLLEQLRQTSSVEAVNRAHFGYTTEKGQAVLQRDLEKGLDCQAALVEFGGNDCDHNWHEVASAPDDDHLPNTPLQRFVENMQAMAQSLKTAGVQPILMTLPPLDAEKYLDFIARLGSDKSAVLHWLGDVQMIYRWQELYSDAIARLALRLDLPLVDVRSRFLARRDYQTLIARDGIHLTEAGYDLVFDELGRTLLAVS